MLGSVSFPLNKVREQLNRIKNLKPAENQEIKNKNFPGKSVKLQPVKKDINQADEKKLSGKETYEENDNNSTLQGYIDTYCWIRGKTVDDALQEYLELKKEDEVIDNNDKIDDNGRSDNIDDDNKFEFSKIEDNYHLAARSGMPAVYTAVIQPETKAKNNETQKPVKNAVKQTKGKNAERKNISVKPGVKFLKPEPIGIPQGSYIGKCL